MKLLRPAALAALLAAALLSLAQDNGYWYAASQTAASITGPIELKPSRLTINFVKIPIVQAHPLTPAEAVALFDTEPADGGSGGLYHLRIAGSQTFFGKNTLCGHDDTQWMATWASGKTLKVAFFSGDQAPRLTFEALNNTSDRCASFTYVR